VAIYNLKELRETAPASLANLSDEELVIEYAANTGQDAQYLAEYFGLETCLLYTSPSPRDVEESRMPSSA